MNLFKTLLISCTFFSLPFSVTFADSKEPHTKHSAAEHRTMGNYALIMSTSLPHLMKPVMKHKTELALTQQQLAQLKQLREEVAPQIHKGLTKAKKIEMAIGEAVIKQKRTLSDMEPQLLELQTQKKMNTDKLINAITKIQEILTTEQYQQLLQLMEKAK